jgi:hypothetical protein
MKSASLPTAVMAFALLGCEHRDSQSELALLVDAAQSAAQARDTGFFADHVAAAYRDARGQDREALLRLIRGYFLTHQRVHVVTRLESATLRGEDAAELVVLTGLLGTEGSSLLSGVEGELYRLELELVEEEGVWQVIGARWDRDRSPGGR